MRPSLIKIIITISLSVLLVACKGLTLTTSTAQQNIVTLVADNFYYFTTPDTTVPVTITNVGNITAQNVAITNLPEGVTTTSNCTTIAIGDSCTETLTITKNAPPISTSFNIQSTNSNTVQPNFTISTPLINLNTSGTPTDTFIESMANSGTTLYAATLSGVYQTSLSGTLNWSLINGFPQNAATFELTVDSHGNLYVISFLNNIYKYADNTWTSLTLNGIPLPQTAVGHITDSIAIDANDNVFIANTSYGIYELAYGMQTWTLLNIPGLQTSGDLTLSASPNGNYIVATDGTNVYDYSISNPTFVNTGFSLGTNLINSLAVDNMNTIYAGGSASDGSEEGGLYIGTQEGGGSWTYQEYDNTNVSQITTITPDGSGNVYASGGIGVYEFNGTGWSLVNISWNGADANTLSYANANLYVGTTNGVLVSNRGTWNIENTGLLLPNINTILYAGSTLYVGYTLPGLNSGGTALTSSYGDGTWSTGSNFTDTNGDIIPTVYSLAQVSLAQVARTFYAGTDFGLFSSSDGSSWSQIIAPEAPPPTDKINFLSTDNATSALVAYDASSQSIYVYSSGTWSNFDLSLLNIAPSSLLSVNRIIYLGIGGEQSGPEEQGLYQCSETGGSCSYSSGSFPTNVYALTADNSGGIYVGTVNDVCKFNSLSSCTSLTPDNPLDNTANALVWVGSNLYAATLSGLYSWTSGAQAWTFIGIVGPPPGATITSLATDGSNLYIGTQAGNYELSNAAFARSSKNATFLPINPTKNLPKQPINARMSHF